jgi:hypothetical protein
VDNYLMTEASCVVATYSIVVEIVVVVVVVNGRQ